MPIVEERSIESALADVAASRPTWAALLEKSLQKQVAWRITCDDREAARGKINVLYRMIRRETYAGRLRLYRRGHVVYIIPVA